MFKWILVYMVIGLYGYKVISLYAYCVMVNG